MSSFDRFDEIEQEGEWVNIESELSDISGNKKNIRIKLLKDQRPAALAFFDIDGTLAHLDTIHSQAIQELFPEEDPRELEDTYYKGFKLGNSFREFDRMRGIYIDGQLAWKDPEIYLRERFIPHAKEIDEPGNTSHDIAAKILKAYGEIAARIASELFKNDPLEFQRSNIAPIFLLAEMYARIGIPMVGFTANAQVFVEKLAKYLKLSDLFIDIATDETMAGGGKEVAIHSLISKVESKGIKISRDRLIFVGDSLRGDIGTSLLAREKDGRISGKGILVLKDREALVDIERQINEDATLRHLADQILIEGLVISDVPLDEKGNPVLLARFRDQFLKRL